MLSSEFTHMEVKQAINHMAPLKALRPNGMPPLFYQYYWNLIGDDIFDTVLHYLNSATLPDHLNHTFITLIPKRKILNLLLNLDLSVCVKFCIKFSPKS